MTQTQTQTAGTPDPDRHPDPDPGPDAARTQTSHDGSAQTQTQTGPDRGLGPGGGPSLDCGLGPGLGPDHSQTRTSQSGSDNLDGGFADGPGTGLGPWSGSARTQTTDLDLGWFARTGARRRARTQAIDEAIRRGVDAERILRQAEATGETDLDAPAPRALWERFAAGWPQTLLTILGAIIASVGQVAFAREHGVIDKIKIYHFDLTPWFAPVVLDLGVAALLGRGMYVAVKNQASPWLAWSGAALIGGFSIYTNTQHEGALFFGGASAISFLSWVVALIYKWWGLPHVKAARAKRKQDREDRRASANPRLLTTSLLIASPKTALRGWVIARRRPMALAAERCSEREGRRITVRMLTIQAAELFNSVLTDRRIAELEQIGDRPPANDRPATQAWSARRQQAEDRAQMVAWDAVDSLLGIPVIERQGIEVRPLTYVEAAPQPQLVTRAALPAPAAPPSPERESGAPMPAARVRSAAPALPPGETPVVVVPAGNAAESKNYLPLYQIEGLRNIDVPADRVCRCHSKDPNKYCGKTLLTHVERRGRYLAKIMADVDEWATRPERIGLTEIKEIIGGNSKGLFLELGYVLDQLRLLAQQQRADRQELASGATVVLAEEPRDGQTGGT